MNVKKLVVWTSVGIVAVVAALIWWSWAALAATSIGRTAVAGIPLWWATGLLLVEIGLIVLACQQFGVFGRRYTYARSVQERYPGQARRRYVVGTIATVLVVLSLPLWYFAVLRPWNRWEHDARHAEINSTLETVKGGAPGFEPRVAYPVAQAQLQRGLGNIRGELQNVRYIPQREQWCGLVVISDGSSWRRPAQAVACVNESGKVDVERFEHKTPSPDARFYWNLKRRVANLARGTTFGEKDPYGYIKDGHAVLVVPVKAFKSAGGGKYYDAPAGVVVYDTKNPEGRYLRNVREGQLDGPVIGISVAEDLRASLNDRFGFKASFQHRAAYEPTDIVGDARDVLDPNAGNTTEFLLNRTDGDGSAFVSPLTPWGRSTQVTAVFVVDAGSVRAGHMPKATLYQLPVARRSLADAAITIAQRYGSNIPFASDNRSAANQVRILEITPGPSADRWIASIGRVPAVSWRVEVGRDLSTRIFDASGTERRYDRGDDPTPIPVGSLIGIGNQPTGPSENPSTSQPVPANGNLNEVPLDQLIAQRIQLQAEIDRRAAGR